MCHPEGRHQCQPHSQHGHECWRPEHHADELPLLRIHRERGSSDQVIINFQTASQNYYNDLKSKSQFAMLCNHGRGHSIPTDARAAVWQFFQAHPFGTVPSPYAGGLPATMPSYCQR